MEMCVRKCCKSQKINNKQQNLCFCVYVHHVYAEKWLSVSLLPLLPTQWLLPAPLSAPRSHPPSLLRSCPLLAKTVNAPSASIRRWTRSSTPAATCVCATTAGWSWRDRSTPAAPYAGGPLKTLSKHIGRDHPPFAPTHVQPGAVSSTDGRCRVLFSG